MRSAEPPESEPERPPSAPELRRRLLGHYDRCRRELPWRGESDPYRIWVSEVMLQQTRVETVIPYYVRWMERFPDLRTLAGADEEDVLRAWEGLGYYSRARNLAAAAREIRERHDCRIPSDPAELRALPGFGAYTAGAVASIAFGRPVPAVDGNVRRVLTRLYDLADPSPEVLARIAAELVDPVRPGDFNQALMDLGATVCTPRAPRCGECPLGASCAALARNTVGLRPGRRARGGVPERRFAAAVLLDAERRTLLVRRPAGGLLARLWSFPEVEVGSGDPAPAAVCLAAELGFACAEGAAALPPVRHAFTHFRATYLPVVLPVPALEAAGPDARRVSPAAPGVPLPAAQKRILASLLRHLEQAEGHPIEARG